MHGLLPGTDRIDRWSTSKWGYLRSCWSEIVLCDGNTEVDSKETRHPKNSLTQVDKAIPFRDASWEEIKVC
jgi:hypothetical protein